MRSLVQAPIRLPSVKPHLNTLQPLSPHLLSRHLPLRLHHSPQRAHQIFPAVHPLTHPRVFQLLKTPPRMALFPAPARLVPLLLLQGRPLPLSTAMLRLVRSAAPLWTQPAESPPSHAVTPLPQALSPCRAGCGAPGRRPHCRPPPWTWTHERNAEPPHKACAGFCSQPRMARRM